MDSNLTQPQSMSSNLGLNNRRYDVDWLRTLAFGLLILYHLGMYYVADWGWHIKSDAQSVWLQDLMILSNQWRMSLLFFVSGMTLALIEGKYSPTSLVRTRFMRLFIPLVFGMLVIVPPQLFFELQQNLGYTGNYWQFFQQYLDLNTELAPEKRTPLGLITWNHLWYLAYLWVYTLVFLAVRPALGVFVRSRLFRALGWKACAVALIATLLVVWFFLRQVFPTTHALVDDWYSHGKYLSVMLFGYLLVYKPVVWQKLIDHRRKLLITAALAYAFIIMDRHGWFPTLAGMFQTSDTIRATYGTIYVTNMWCWLLAAVGYAGRYLNRPSSTLNYANQAVLAWYILHQTLIIVFAMALKPLALAAGLEALGILILTVATCFVSYEVIRRNYILKLLFGIKNSHSPKVSEQKVSGYTG